MEDRVYNPKEYLGEDLKNKSGIYQIRNLVNNKIYIGSSNNLYIRKVYGHFSLLEKNSHENEYLQKSFNKYGKENFIFEVIEFCKTDDILKIEQYWLNRFYDNKNMCYNINPISDKPPSFKGRIVSIETRDKISKIHKGKIVSETTRKKISEKMKERFKKPENNPMYGRKHSKKSREKMSRVKIEKGSNKGSKNYSYGRFGKLSAVAVKVVNLEDGKIFDCIKDCIKEYNISRYSIYRHCNNKIKKVAQKFMYYSDYLKLNIDS